ncbi:MAG TPA: putative zinc-binding protein [Anaerolineaceae bacterium]
MTGKQIAIVPCSGIGKTYGSVSRDAAYQVVEDDRPETTRLIPLALLVMGDAEYRQVLAECPAVTIDGCKLACATKMVKESGGVVAQDYAVLEVYRRYKEFKPHGISELNEGGLKLAIALAAEIAAVIDSLSEDENPPNNQAAMDAGGQNG